MINTIRNIFHYRRKMKTVKEDVIQSQLNAMEVLIITEKNHSRMLKLKIEKLKDDVQYWMKRANANGYRALDGGKD